MAKNRWQSGDSTGGAPHKHVAYHRQFTEFDTIEFTVRPVRVGTVMQYMDPMNGTLYLKHEVRRVITGPEHLRKKPGKKKALMCGTGTGKVGYQFWPVGHWAGGIIK